VEEWQRKTEKWMTFVMEALQKKIECLTCDNLERPDFVSDDMENISTTQTTTNSMDDVDG
jgi:hypothetical protein